MPYWSRTSYAVRTCRGGLSCTMIRLHPASGAVVDEAIYLVNSSGGNRREIQCSGVRRREDRTGLQPPGGVTSRGGEASSVVAIPRDRR